MEKLRYYNIKTKAVTESAVEALKWHKSGEALEVWNGKKTTHINGAEVESEQARFDREEGRERCKYIAGELDSYAGGYMHKCPNCGEVVKFPDGVGDKFKCPHCEEVAEVEEWEELSIYDYLDDILDIDFTVNRFKEYQSCSICVGFGGPNIYIDTVDAYVKLYWGSTREKYPIKYSTSDVIDDWARDYWDCI